MRILSNVNAKEMPILRNDNAKQCLCQTMLMQSNSNAKEY